jgi:hypothetical protein
VIFVLIFISIIDDLWWSSKENNVPDEFLTERYIISRINVLGRLSPWKRNRIQRMKITWNSIPKTFLKFGFNLIGRIIGLWLFEINGVRTARFVRFVILLSTISSVDRRFSVSMIFDVLFTGIQPWLINCGISIKLKMTLNKRIDYHTFFSSKPKYLINYYYYID